MSKHKQYVVTLCGIFIGQLFCVSLFVFSFEGSETQKAKIGLLESQTKSLKSEIDHLKEAKTRRVASLPAGAQAQLSDLKFDLSDLYFTQLEKYKKSKNKEAALEMIQKVQGSTQNKDSHARAEFEKINLICTVRLEADCMKALDHIMTQYPSSNWTAKSLLLLSHFYYQQNRVTESKSLLKTIQNEFKSYNEMNYDIQKLASQSL